MLSSEPTPVAAALPSTEAEAARYALLRRLAPSMRHHLVVNLQPIGTIYEVMDRRLRAPQPDLAQVQESAGKINGFARAALNSCLDVVGWLAQDDAAPIGLQEGVRECAALLATSLSFRGYAVRNEVGAVPGQVRRAALRSLFTAALVQVTDDTRPPADLVLTATAEADGAVLAITVMPTEGDKGFTSEQGYRKLEWRDLEALAAAERVRIVREGNRVEIRLPWVAA